MQMSSRTFTVVLGPCWHQPLDDPRAVQSDTDIVLGSHAHSDCLSCQVAVAQTLVEVYVIDTIAPSIPEPYGRSQHP